MIVLSSSMRSYRCLIFLTLLFASQSTLMAQKNADWNLRDKAIDIEQAKEEGFAISFRAANSIDLKGRKNIRKVDLIADQDLGDLQEKLFYYVDLKKKKVSVYTYNEKLFSYSITRTKSHGNEFWVKIKDGKDRVWISVELDTHRFKQLRYYKGLNLSVLTVHDYVYLYPKD